MPGNLGGAREDALKRVIAKSPERLSVGDAGSVEAFIDAWGQYLDRHARHLRALKKVLTAPVFVVHVDDCDAVGSSLSWRRRSTLGTSEADQLDGVVAIANSATGGFARAPACCALAECEDVIRAAGLNSRPTIMLSSVSKLIVWPNGIEGDAPPIEREFDDAGIVVDIAAIDSCLSEFYEEVARQNTYWWRDAKNYVTKGRPEFLVQHDLHLYLIAKLISAARVKEEYRIGNGRADLTIWPRKNDGTHQSAVLELKAIRQYEAPRDEASKPSPISRKESLDWACSGIQQTAAYRDDEQMDAAFLCVFDFRSENDKTLDDAISPIALTYKVLNRRYWITGSHKAHREDRYPLQPDC